MKLTNKLNLPRSIENAVRNDPYSRGNANISVTTLIGPARIRALAIKHADEIEEDVSDRIWALLGQITHGILERADDDSFTEERLFISRHGWRISGSFDRYALEPDGRLSDYKLTSTYTIKDGAKPEWTAQTNIYALMLREHGYKVGKQEIIAILRDWQKSKAKNAQYNYPKQSVVVLPVDVWPQEQTETFIRQRLIAHGKAQHELPECSDEERWATQTVYAILKKGNKTAVSLHYSPTEAAEALRGLPTYTGAYSIVERPGEQRRCADYCIALPFCTQGQALLQKTHDYKVSKMWNVNIKIPQAV